LEWFEFLPPAPVTTRRLYYGTTKFPLLAKPLESSFLYFQHNPF